MIEIKHLRTGKVLYRIDGDTLEGADLAGLDLRQADLTGVNLTRANMSEVNLEGANLTYARLIEVNLSDASLLGASLNWATLEGANMSRVNLTGASLIGTNLSYVGLTDAILSWTKLTGATLTGATLFYHIADEYNVYIQPAHTCIGCQHHTNEYWLEATPDSVRHLADDAYEWWAKHGEKVKELIRQAQALCKETKLFTDVKHGKDNN